ncbi:MAG: hypothetical protein PWQ87_1 [Candidatus Woesearchaeota archaeon]|nr:hypothetical protein [Candidatus Woesearchaeota archaeon]
MKISYFLIIFIVTHIIFSSLVLAADCDYTPLNNRITELEKENALLQENNSLYIELLSRYDNISKSYEILQKKYTQIKSERDFFESKYLNTSLGNMTIGDFIIYMNKIENHYNSINQSITHQINQMITIRNWTIGISLTFSIALLSVTFIFFKQIKRHIITKISEIMKLKVKHETKIQTK